MKKLKVLALIFRELDVRIEYLALRNNPADPAYGGDFWFVVTGNVEPGETLEDAVRREVMEETGIEHINRVIDPHIVYHYQYRDVKVEEHAFLVEVGENVQHLNEENVEYQWLQADSFTARIQWDNDLVKLVDLMKWAVK